MLLLQGVSVSQKMKVFEIIACFGIHKYTILWIRRSVFRWVKMQPAFFGKSIFITCDCQRFFAFRLRMTLHIYRHTEALAEVSVFSLILTDSSGVALRMTLHIYRHIERSEISFFWIFSLIRP